MSAMQESERGEGEDYAEDISRDPKTAHIVEDILGIRQATEELLGMIRRFEEEDKEKES